MSTRQVPARFGIDMDMVTSNSENLSIKAYCR